jgi:pyruvate dehydrogenase E2 component (dihydrolipoamide acetyltransferase)
VRKLIRENELDVSQLTGTGEGGRITRKDVEAYIESGGPASVTTPAATVPAPATPPPSAPAAAEPAVAEPKPEPEQAPPAPAPAAAATGSPDVEEVELNRIRIRTAENMIKAKQTAAHVWTSVEVDYERVERVRQARIEQFKSAEGFSLTYLPFISRAVIDALREYPVVNSSFYLEEKKAVFHKKVDLGIAVDLNQGGLVVARIRDADSLRLVGIARAIRDLAEQARSGQLGVDDLTGSTFTITNPGPFGSYLSVPIINVPNVAILSTETVSKRATVVTDADGQDMIAIRHIGYLGLTWDHRAFDGSTAVLFLQRIKSNLETWDWEQELA